MLLNSRGPILLKIDNHTATTPSRTRVTQGHDPYQEGRVVVYA